MHMRHKPPIGKGAPAMEACPSRRLLRRPAYFQICQKRTSLGVRFFCRRADFFGMRNFPRTASAGRELFCISRFGKAYSPRYWVSALHRRLRRAPLLGRCGFLRRPNPAAETSRVLWPFRGRFVSRWGGNRNIGGGNLSQGALAPSVCGASCARCAASRGLGNKSDFSGKRPCFGGSPNGRCKRRPGSCKKKGRQVG